mmetsp:Transcript_2667/g.3098  ORF Transcript_2667/g.3098 Transcript_2667/m.3098 type:complete len:323 (-) Transcript_2667:1958-2926(-)
MARALGKCLLVLLLLFGVQAEFSTDHSQEEVDAMIDTKLTNLDEVMQAVGFPDMRENPYPKRDWYDTQINRDTRCWVVFESDDHVNYRLVSSDEQPPGDSYLTHYGQCGVCSTLQDLAVYISNKDLTNPVRSCTTKLIGGLQRKCLRKLGFTPACTFIWYHNAHNTGSISPSGGCFGVCVRHIFSPNNIPSGTNNPCEPEPDQLVQNSDGSFGAHIAGPGPEAEDTAPFCVPCGKGTCCGGKRTKTGRCGNTINGMPACDKEQYEDGQYRLNACLQCDECRSGPVFQKIAGRTRRNSGLRSEIERPLAVDPIHHHYCVGRSS